ncbi:MAG: DUF4012 domain-containing protein [Candidatus Taylorbacteria bacterium]|nr:DUF4012 domain-containing protein [Candidatus Taylorbacteria bacterium]
MTKGFKGWVIDIIPPRKARFVAESTMSTMGTIAVAMVPMVEGFVSESLEFVLDSNSDPVAELVKAGAVIKNQQPTTRNLQPIIRKMVNRLRIEKYKLKKEEGIKEDFSDIVAQIQAPINFAVANLPLTQKSEPGLIGYIKSEQIVSSPVSTKGHLLQLQKVPFVGKKYWKLFVLMLGVFGFVVYGLGLKNEIWRNSGLAVSNIKTAQANFEDFNFDEAADNFHKSYENFNQASRDLNFLGAGLVGILGDIPGTGKFKSAKSLAEAGKLLTGSGRSISEALAILSKAGSILNPNEASKIKPSKMITQLRNALELSSNNFKKAKALLLYIDVGIIPEDNRKDFIDFKEKLPLLEGLIANAYKYTDFLESVVGVDEHKKYLILFNNYSELRPTGGFPGTYGVISFSNGGVENLFVEDVYNLDGQLKRKVIPPKQLQHITPIWGMRDAAWFVDFPTSARKVMSFFTEEAGYEVDGVIALNPDVISHILKAIGPIEMSEYGLTLTADNFLTNIQEEVEYGENRTQPKTVIMDFVPRLLERLYSASSGEWLEIFRGLMTNLEEKDMIFYFDEFELEEFVIKEGVGGEIKKTDSDYLTVNFSNIKGSKTDLLIDSTLEIEARPEKNKVVHRLVITRDHNGGNHEHGFYNRQNPTYVRVLIPKNSELLNISGNDLPQYQPLVNYQNSDHERDKDLAKFESGFYFDESNRVDRFEESDKNGIGFWMVTDPGDTKTVVLEYSSPLRRRDGEYSFYFQKQPGLDWKNFKFKWNGSYLVNMELKKDLEIPVKIR